MDVYIFGVGRSGTKLAYSLLQSIFDAQYGSNFRSTYEPFLWDWEIFNKPIAETQKLFGKTSALSVEGIYNHIKTPLFVRSTSKENYQGNEFFGRFTKQRDSAIPHLVKFIRANGRMPIFRALNPNARIILITRNPVDTINSVKDKFSLFGEDFHRSDYPRFCQQLSNEGTLMIAEQDANWVQRQTEYCLQMNRAACEFAIGDPQTQVFEFDNFVQDKTSAVKKMCAFLDVPFSIDYVKELDSPIGILTKSLTLSQAEFESAFASDNLYTQLCKRVGLDRSKTGADIYRQYNGNCHAMDFDPEYQGWTTIRLRNCLRQCLARELQSKEDDAHGPRP